MVEKKSKENPFDQALREIESKNSSSSMQEFLNKEEQKNIQISDNSISKVEEPHKNNDKIVVGRLVFIKEASLIFDLGGKEEGYCDSSEFDVLPKEGDTYPVYIKNREKDGTIHVSHIEAKKHEMYSELSKHYASKQPIDVIVDDLGETSYKVSYKKIIELHLPKSQATSRYRLPVKKNDSIKVAIIKLLPQSFSAIVSYRMIVQQEVDAAWTAIDGACAVGDVVKAEIIKKASFGIFMNFRGIDGLLHRNDISYLRNFSKTHKGFAVGDILSVKIIKLDIEKRKLNFGLKQLAEDPWIWAKNELKVGDRVQGIVQGFVAYGAFVLIENKLEALVYRTELSWMANPKAPTAYLKKGEEREFSIKSIDLETKRVCLSIKDLEGDQWEAQVARFPAGSIVKGKVITVTKNGLFAEVAEGLESFIMTVDYAWENPRSDMFKKKDIIEYKIRKIDFDKKRIYGSVKELHQSPAEKYYESLPKDSMLKATVIKDVSVGFVLRINESSMTGFLSAHALRGSVNKKSLAIGKEQEVCVTGVDRMRIGLTFSLKKPSKKSKKKEKLSFALPRSAPTHIYHKEMPSTYTPFEVLAAQTTKKTTKKTNKKFSNINKKDSKKSSPVVMNADNTSAENVKQSTDKVVASNVPLNVSKAVASQDTKTHEPTKQEKKSSSVVTNTDNVSAENIKQSTDKVIASNVPLNVPLNVSRVVGSQDTKTHEPTKQEKKSSSVVTNTDNVSAENIKQSTDKVIASNVPLNVPLNVSRVVGSQDTKTHRPKKQENKSSPVVMNADNASDKNVKQSVDKVVTPKKTKKIEVLSSTVKTKTTKKSKTANDNNTNQSTKNV